MNIFFTTSIRGLNKFKQNYDLIYKLINELGHKYIGNYPFTVTTKEVYSYGDKEILDFFNQLNNHMKNCDIMILEISAHSISMGYLIMKMLSMKKPVIALYTKGNKPAFLAGIEDENFQLIEYNLQNIKKTLIDAIDYSKGNNLSRFNLLLDSNLTNYLELEAEKDNISKAAFIRKLIKEHKKENS